MMDTHLFITGFMGSGKSTIGKKLAARLHVPFIDTDDEIEKRWAKSIKDIFKEDGESAFRRVEEEEIRRQCRREEKAVIALGGGALISEMSRNRILKCGILIYVESSPESIWRRTHHSIRRPLMPQSNSPEDHVQKIRDLMQERSLGYQAAHLKVNRDNMEADEVVNMLIVKLQLLWRRMDGAD